MGVQEGMPMWTLERHGTGGEIEREGGREGERASICETVTVDIWGCGCAVGMFAWDMPDSSEPRTPGPRSHFVTMVVKADVICQGQD